MLYWAVVFLIIALVAAMFGFGELLSSGCGPGPPSARPWWDAGGSSGTSKRIGGSSWRLVPMR